MNTTAFQIARIVTVLALVGVAAVLATPKGRLPLALRGLAKMLRNDRLSEPRPSSHVRRPSFAKCLFAFVLVLLAILLALA